MEIVSLVIRANRWFQKTYGNTYHTVYVDVTDANGETRQLNSVMTYGYDSAYLQTAAKLLIANGYEVDDTHLLPRFCRENGIELVHSVRDVLKREL